MSLQGFEQDGLFGAMTLIRATVNPRPLASGPRRGTGVDGRRLYRVRAPSLVLGRERHQFRAGVKLRTSWVRRPMTVRTSVRTSGATATGRRETPGHAGFPCYREFGNGSREGADYFGVWAALARLLEPLPSRWLDAGHDFVAARRYRWFGRFETCALPSGEHRSKFLDDASAKPR